MKKFFLLLILEVISISTFYAQVSVGEWQDYFSYSNVHSVEKVNNVVYAASVIGIISYDVDERAMTHYSKVTGLSDVNISAIGEIPNTDKLFIGYEDGNMDIFDGTTVENIPDLEMKSMLASKQINNVYFYNGLAYCSTDFGIMVVNVEDLEISETYYIGDAAAELQVNQITSVSDSFFVATEEGLKKAYVNSNALNYYNTSEDVDGFSKEVTGVINVNDFLVVAVTNGSNKIIYKYTNGIKQLIATVSNYRKLEVMDSGFAIVCSNAIYIYNSNCVLQKTISEYAFEDQNFTRSFSSIVKTDDYYYIGDRNGGLIKNDGVGDTQILPSGPYSNNCFKLKATSKALWTVAGNFKQTNPTAAQASVLRDGSWTYLTNKTSSYLAGAYNLCDIAIDPRNENHVYLSSYYNGVFEINGDTVSHFYNDSNSGLQEVWIWELVGGITLDDSGNLYMNNQEVSYPIVVKPDLIQESDTSDLEWYQYNYMPYDDPDDQCWLKDMIYTDWGDIWAISSAENSGVFIFSTNGTLDDDSDDTYKSPNTGFTDSRHTQIKLWIEENSVITELDATPQCIVQDKNNYIWVGLSEGLIVYYQPQAVFDTDVPVASEIKVPRNDGSGNADYLLEGTSITALDVDGANRKWIGTESDGLYLVSSDGTNILESFNTSNSPLPSDNITSISVNPSTGEVFIGTDAGIVSYMGSATEGEDDYSTVTVYPNPVRADYEGDITIKGLVENSLVKITDISGNLVYEAYSTGGEFVWNGYNFKGRKVQTGVYLIYANNEDGEMDMVQKIMIIR